MKNFNYVIAYEILQKLYSLVLRKIIVKALEDPESEFDEWVIKLLDSLFGYAD